MGVSRSRERANRGRGSTPPPVCLSQKSQPLSSGLEGCGGSSVTKQASCKSGKDSSRQPQRHTRYTPHAQQQHSAHSTQPLPECLCACLSLARRLARPENRAPARAHTPTHARARARAHAYAHAHNTHVSGAGKHSRTHGTASAQNQRCKSPAAAPPLSCARVPRLSAESRRLRCSARGSASPRS